MTPAAPSQGGRPRREKEIAGYFGVSVDDVTSAFPTSSESFFQKFKLEAAKNQLLLPNWDSICSAIKQAANRRREEGSSRAQRDLWSPRDVENGFNQALSENPGNDFISNDDHCSNTASTTVDEQVLCDPPFSHSTGPDQLYQTIVENYQSSARAALSEAQTQVESSLRRAGEHTREFIELTEYSTILKSCAPEEVITSNDYISLEFDGPTNKIVICSSEQAQEILQLGPPKLPIVIPAELSDNAQHRVDQERYVKFLKSYETIDVQDYGAESFEPTRMKSSDAIERLFDTTRPPINLLDLRGFKQNPVPPCLAELDLYQLLDVEHTQVGKVQGKVHIDLKESSRFHLFAGAGAFSLPHVDRHGTITAVRVETGRKLWPLWPGMSFEDLEEWATSGTIPNTPIAIFLGPGDEMIQPQHAAHAPFSLTLVLMTGTMHMHSQGLLGTLQQTKLELEHRQITNEDHSPQFISKMQDILNLWQAEVEKDSYWEWQGPEELGKCLALFNDIKRLRRGNTRKRRRV